VLGVKGLDSGVLLAVQALHALMLMLSQQLDQQRWSAKEGSLVERGFFEIKSMRFPCLKVRGDLANNLALVMIKMQAHCTGLALKF